MSQNSLFNLSENYLSDYVGFVYITINKENGKSYIGQKHFKQKGESWETYLGSGKIIKRAINKYGIDSFYKVIIGFGKTNKELNEMEKEIIDVNNATHNDLFYNIANGGYGGNTFAGYTEEEFTKYCNNLRGENNPFYGKKHTEKSKKIMLEKRKYRIYKPMTKEQKALMSEVKKEMYRNGYKHPSCKKYVILFKDGREEKYDSQTNMLKEICFQKRDIQRLKRYDIPQFKDPHKKQFFENIEKIYENNIVVFDSKLVTDNSGK